MPILITLLAALAVTSPSQNPQAFKMAELFTLTKGARQEMGEAIRDYRLGDRSYAIAQIRGLLLDQTPSVGFEDKTQDAEPVRRAVGAWQTSLSETPFRLTQPKERPDVTVRLVSQIDGAQDDQGEVTFGASNGRFQAEILVLNNVEGRPIAPQEEQAVITHELGHVLGLEDSEDGTGLMGTFDPEQLVLKPTELEIKAVSQLRNDLRQELRAYER